MKFLRILLIILAILALLAVAVFIAASLLDTEERAAPAESPGYHQTTLQVAHREGEDATLDLFMWYPTSTPDATPELFAQNALFYGFHAIPDAAPADGTHPVIVLSHGSGGNVPQMGWLARDLALRGFIVLGVNHPGTTSGDSDPHRTPQFWYRTNDLKATLDWVLETPPLGLQPDTTRIASLGFSFGGHTALALAGIEVSKDAYIAHCEEYSDKFDCGWMNAAGVDFTAIDASKYNASHRDPRIVASVSVDPALPRAMTAESLSAIDIPLQLIMLGTREDVPAAMNVTPILEHLRNYELHETQDSWHFSFLAECSTLGRVLIGLVESENICSDLALRDRADVHTELRPVIADFMENALGAAQ